MKKTFEILEGVVAVQNGVSIGVDAVGAEESGFGWEEGGGDDGEDIVDE